MALGLLPGCALLNGWTACNGCSKERSGQKDAVQHTRDVVLDDNGHPYPSPPNPLPIPPPPRPLDDPGMTPSGPIVSGDAKAKNPLFPFSRRITQDSLPNERASGYPFLQPEENKSQFHGTTAAKDTDSHQPTDVPAGKAAMGGPALEPPPRKEPLVLALEKFLQRQPDEALKELRNYDTGTQEFFLRLLPVIAQLTQKKLEQLDPQETTALYDQLDSLLFSLRARSELEIGKIRFCESIDKPLPEHYGFRAKNAEQPGEKVYLYVELRNLTSEKRAQAYETRLSFIVEVLDRRGVKLWSQHLGDRILRSSAPGRDRSLYPYFFVPDLPPGAYTLVLDIHDRTRPGAERVARKALPFRVAP
jgi:hypothetical protein